MIAFCISVASVQKTFLITLPSVAFVQLKIYNHTTCTQSPLTFNFEQHWSKGPEMKVLFALLLNHICVVSLSFVNGTRNSDFLHIIFLVLLKHKEVNIL